MDLVKALSEQYVKSEVPEVEVGDTVRVSIKFRLSMVPLSPKSTAESTRP